MSVRESGEAMISYLTCCAVIVLVVALCFIGTIFPLGILLGAISF